MYLLLPIFTSEISYESIALYKYKLAPCWWPSRILYYEYHFQVLEWSCTMIYSEMFKPSLCRYSTRSQITLDIPLQKINTGQKRLSFLRSNIWSKANSSIKNVKKPAFFMHALKKSILLYLQTYVNANNYHFIMINFVINFLIAVLYFLVIMIGIFLSHYSYFTLVFLPFSLYFWGQVLMEISTFWSFSGYPNHLRSTSIISGTLRPQVVGTVKPLVYRQW